MKQFFKFAFAGAFGFIIAGFVMTALFISVIVVAVAQMEGSVYQVKPNSVLNITLQGEISERSKENPLAGLMSDLKTEGVGLDDILSAIDKAESNENIRGILLEMKISDGGMASYEEIRSRLIKFKKTGKFVLAYGDLYSQKEYFLASVADTVLINPIGAIDIKGLGGEPMFFKNALDKLGIEMQIFKVGTYKSAVEPFITDKMSDANRAQVTEYINGIWKHVVKEMSASRRILPDTLNAYADRGLLFQPAEQLLKYKLVDKLIYRSDLWDFVKTAANSDENEEKDGLVDLKQMNSTESTENNSDNVVAVVYAAGAIDDPTEEGINSEALVKELKKIKADSAVKAVVLRVNSPGGSAFGSEQVWHLVNELVKAKPVVISMGDYAASGGYYIACPASAIVAQPTTLTGSIGIFGMFPNVEKLTDKLGLTFDEVATNKYATTPSVNRPMRSDEKALFQRYIERGYSLFTSRCAAGRKVPVAKIEAVAQGRVWTGEMALKLGLVDKLGGLETAKTLAASKAKLADYRVETFPRKKPFLEEIFSDMNSEVSASLAKIYLGENYKHYRFLQSVQKQYPVQARMPYLIKID